jgi:hypothetical protein
MGHNFKKTLMNEQPKEEAKDYLYELTKGAISAVPLVGGVAAEFFTLIISSPLQTRMNKWLEELYNEVIKLKETHKEFEVERLKQNEPFISSITHATQIVLRTHQLEKLIALKNATLNSAKDSFKDIEHNIFLNLISNFSPKHLIILSKISKSPISFIEDDVQLIDRIIELAEVPIEFALAIQTDIENAGLISRTYQAWHTEKRSPKSRIRITISISNLGNSFLKFIDNASL